MAKYVTILDIARELGISKSTVSRALSGDTSNVKAATIEKILDTARRMGYHRNELAVNLRKQSTHNIEIIIPEIITSFYMNFVNHVQGILRKEGYKVIIAVSNESPEQERENIQMMEQIRVDGILMSVCNKDKNQDLYNKVIERGIPIVFFDRTLERKQVSQVRMDDNIMSFFMVEALIDQGRKHIVHIPGPSYSSSYYHSRGATCGGDGKGGLSIALGTFARYQSASRGHRAARRDDFPRIFPEEIRVILPTII